MRNSIDRSTNPPTETQPDGSLAAEAAWWMVGLGVGAANWIAERGPKTVLDVPKAPLKMAGLLLRRGPFNSHQTGARLGREYYDALESTVDEHQRDDGWGSSVRHAAAALLVAKAGQRQIDSAEGVPVTRDLSTTVRREFKSRGIPPEITEEIASHPVIREIGSDTDVIPVALAQKTVGLSDVSPFRRSL